MNLDGFADLWEHVRLLSDEPRNDALLTLLRRRAEGQRVLEIGCGTGILSCVAARLGATSVVAVEPTEQAELAAELVRANQLEHLVTVLQAPLEDLPPQPMDSVFSELLNADPFAEGLLEISEVARRWVAPGGRLAPDRMRLWAAPVEASDSSDEVCRVRRTLAHLGAAFGLDLDPVTEELAELEPYSFIAPKIILAAKQVLVADIALGRGEALPARVPCEFETIQPIEAVAVWFEAQLDDDLWLGNPPGSPGHWGHLVLGLPAPVVPRLRRAQFTFDLSDGDIVLHAGST